MGALVGLAVGDALGTTLEFTRRDDHPLQTEMTGGGPFGLKPGQWTDDTSMAMALADSLIMCGGLDPRDLMERFVAWRRDGAYSCTGTCFDIGIQTRQALEVFARTGNPFAGPSDENKAGNGSLMRVSPVALFALGDPERAAEIAREQSRTTHGAPQCVEACDLFTMLLREAILGEPKEAVLRPRTWRGHPEVERVARGEWRGKPRDAISSSGYVISTLEAALWCVNRTSSFEEALILAVNLGHDADTVGAVTGQLAGAIYGYSGIPNRWLTNLAWRDRLEAIAHELLRQGAAGASCAPIAEIIRR